ncbi:MAG: T9SS type A sorting domain-containing protein [Chitinophagaceae bacterium]
MVNTNPYYDNAPPWSFGTIGDGVNGWVQQGSTTLLSTNTANGIVPVLSGLEVLIPAGATYQLGFSASTLQYQTLTSGAGTNTFTQGGVSIITGDGISWGGTVYPSTPANYPRGFIGGITFVPATPCDPSFHGTISSNRSCTTGSISLSVPYSGTNTTYQWASSATGDNFTPIAAATSRIYNTSVSSDTYFRCYVTCSDVTDTTPQFLATTPKTGHITPTICYGTTLSLNGSTYSSSGTYTQVLTASTGCDSTLTIDLTVLNAITGTLDTAICAGTSLTIGGTSYTTAGTYTKVLTAANGCDSTLTLHLTIKQPTSSTVTQTACSSYTLNGTNYTTSGTYTQTLTNAAGCDSTITLNLTIKQPTSSTLTRAACSSYALNGTTYTTSGTYTQTLTNAAGCDSTITLNLTIKQPTSSTFTRTACSSYALNGTTYTSSGTYTQTLTNAAGCDSTITLNLTIKQPTSSTITQIVCSSYALNGQTYTKSGTYTQTLTNAAGCDSTLTLNLTVESIDASVTQNGQTLTANGSGAGITYQWIDCATGNNIAGATGQTYTATTNGSYKVVVSKGICSSSSTCYTVNNLTLSVYPNPSNGAFTIRLEKTYQKIQVEVYDITGKSVLHRQAVNKNIITISESLTNGLYQIRIHADGVVITKNIVITR